ncbi:MAG: Eco57I restriction-modification methylase domain-containing protein, partial [Candidatus Rokuibacteriota bacterium]
MPAGYDLAISNPPYFKLPGTDSRATAASSIVHGQPNVYALFMSLTAALLAPSGVMVTITPRSFATGDYFRRFREHFFKTVAPEAIHLFHSRKSAFRSDEVLQENMILRSRRTVAKPTSRVLITTSHGAEDLSRPLRHKATLRSVVDPASPGAILSIP